VEADITVWSKVLTVVATLAVGGGLESVFVAQLVGGGGALALSVYSGEDSHCRPRARVIGDLFWRSDTQAYRRCLTTVRFASSGPIGGAYAFCPARRLVGRRTMC
jgi:hypothetical protein